MKSIYHYIKTLVLFSVLSFTVSQSFSQQAGAQLEKEQITLGEQIKLKLSLSRVDKGSIVLSEWFNLPDTGNHIEVIKREKVDSSDAGNNTINISQANK